ncbi:hypothetical protein BUALT_Bualt03G0231500 [Buddleja alternifolia]|uniref:hAT-like transposase RNase-H fold domain-containing protein n=1 Tax=Buddleja alternifolia TaxID=168488 RepID=A0AAV6Y3B8_9LAMI|nr:hypothetical protein BUALT_Bualt03G0231500 [Buddleja alternifolia]
MLLNGKVLNSVVYWTASPARVEKFEECARQLKIDREKYYHSIPTDEDLVNAKEILAKESELDGSKYGKENVGKYNKYWDTCHIMMGVVAVLDPRYKMILVKFYFRKIYKSVFSTSGILLNPHRSMLHPSTVEELMCSRRWLWKEANVPVLVPNLRVPASLTVPVLAVTREFHSSGSEKHVYRVPTGTRGSRGSGSWQFRVLYYAVLASGPINLCSSNFGSTRTDSE